MTFRTFIVNCMQEWCKKMSGFVARRPYSESGVHRALAGVSPARLRFKLLSE